MAVYRRKVPMRNAVKEIMERRGIQRLEAGHYVTEDGRFEIRKVEAFHTDLFNARTGPSYFCWSIFRRSDYDGKMKTMTREPRTLSAAILKLESFIQRKTVTA